MIHFDCSNLSVDDAKFYFSNTISEKDGKFYMTFPKFKQDNSFNDFLTPIVELPINHKNIQKLKKLIPLINPGDEQNKRYIFAIEDDARSENLYSLYLLKIPNKKIKELTSLEDLDDRIKFMEKVESKLAYCDPTKTPSHPQTLSAIPTSSASSDSYYLSYLSAPPAQYYSSSSNYGQDSYYQPTSSAQPASYYQPTSSAQPAQYYSSSSNYGQDLYYWSTSSAQPASYYQPTSSAQPASYYQPTSSPYHETFCSFFDTFLSSRPIAPKPNPNRGGFAKPNLNDDGYTSARC